MSYRILTIILTSYFAQIPLMAEDKSPLPLDSIIKKMELATDPENNKIKIKTLITGPKPGGEKYQSMTSNR